MLPRGSFQCYSEAHSHAIPRLIPMLSRGSFPCYPEAHSNATPRIIPMLPRGSFPCYPEAHSHATPRLIPMLPRGSFPCYPKAHSHATPRLCCRIFVIPCLCAFMTDRDRQTDLNDLQLDSLISLNTYKTPAYCVNDSITQLLVWIVWVWLCTPELAIGNQFLCECVCVCV